MTCSSCGQPASRFGALADRLQLHPDARLASDPTRIWPLSAQKRGDRTVFDAAGGVEWTVAQGWPVLRARAPVEIRMTRKGEPTWVPRSSTGLFTETTKMAAPSFSLPAGAIRSGGTCKAAELSSRMGSGFICDACYATKANYIYKDVIFAQAIRLQAVTEALRSNPTGYVLAEQLVAAITATAKAGAGQKARERLHLGIWDGQALVVPASGRAAASLQIPDAPLPHFGSERAVWRGVPAGVVAGFFRIHDAGDVMPGPDPALWPGYIAAWIEVARQLPHVHFWMPTRAQPFKNLVQAMQNRPPNLTIRPSALMEDTLPPSVPGLDAGSSVDRAAAPAAGTWHCPVYQAATPKEKNCADMGCRTCWLFARQTVSYHAH